MSVKIERSLIRNPDFPKSLELPLNKERLLFLPKLLNNADIRKHFWRNQAICTINKGNQTVIAIKAPTAMKQESQAMKDLTDGAFEIQFKGSVAGILGFQG